MNEQEVEAGMIGLMRRGLAAPQDGGEAQSKVIIEFRGLLKEWLECIDKDYIPHRHLKHVSVMSVEERTREALK